MQKCNEASTAVINAIGLKDPCSGHLRTVSSSSSRAVATSAQLQPSLSNTTAFARRTIRPSLRPSRASARSSLRSALLRKPGRIMPRPESFFGPPTSCFSDIHRVGVYQEFRRHLVSQPHAVLSQVEFDAHRMHAMGVDRENGRFAMTLADPMRCYLVS